MSISPVSYVRKAQEPSNSYVPKLFRENKVLTGLALLALGGIYCLYLNRSSIASSLNNLRVKLGAATDKQAGTAREVSIPGFNKLPDVFTESYSSPSERRSGAAITGQERSLIARYTTTEQKYNEIAEHFPYHLAVRGDGQCAYRSFAMGVLEIIDRGVNPELKGNLRAQLSRYLGDDHELTKLLDSENKLFELVAENSTYQDELAKVMRLSVCDYIEGAIDEEGDWGLESGKPPVNFQSFGGFSGGADALVNEMYEQMLTKLNSKSAARFDDVYVREMFLAAISLECREKKVSASLANTLILCTQDKLKAKQKAITEGEENFGRKLHIEFPEEALREAIQELNEDAISDVQEELIAGALSQFEFMQKLRLANDIGQSAQTVEEHLASIRSGEANQVSAQEQEILSRIFNLPFLEVSIYRAAEDSTGCYPPAELRIQEYPPSSGYTRAKTSFSEVQESLRNQPYFALFLANPGHANLLLGSPSERV
ncbi:MAG: hypothetical protein GWP59_08110 [Chlamydiales bacterium]|nr:hypothetical protein [Chlamydiales bacterium]